MASETNTKQENKVMAHIPVTVTILVPVEMEVDVELSGDEEEIDGCAVVDLLQRDDSESLICDLMKKMGESELVSDALGALMSGAHCFKRDNPQIKAQYTPYLGIVGEREF